jgi:hypothetical protein
MSAFRTGRVVAIAATLAFVASCSDVTAPLALEGGQSLSSFPSADSVRLHDSSSCAEIP